MKLKDGRAGMPYARRTMKRWMMYIGVLLLVASCTADKTSVAGPKSIWDYPGVYAVDSVTDIQAYFDSLCHECGADVWTHTPENGDSQDVWNAVRELHRFVNHQRGAYPAEEVKTALRHMAFEQGYAYSHGADETDSVSNGEARRANAGEAFLFRFLEQAAAHSPRLDFVTDLQAEDGKAGILYFPEWSGLNPLYSFLVYRAGQGYKVLMVGQKGNDKINKLYSLTDNQGRVYYLCSNNDSPVYFRQYLYGFADGQMTLLSEGDDVEWGGWEDGYELVFDSARLTWNFFQSVNGARQKVEGAPTYRLRLDGDKSAFEMEK